MMLDSLLNFSKNLNFPFKYTCIKYLLLEATPKIRFLDNYEKEDERNINLSIINSRSI